MRKVKLDKLKPGMIVAKTLRDEEGNVLMRKGMKLNGLIIKQLSKWTIPSVWIKDKNEVDLQDAIEVKKMRRKIEQSLEVKFQRVSEDSIMNEFKSILLRYLLEKQIR